MTNPTTIKLPDKLKERIAPLADAAGKTPHAWMVEALERQADLAARAIVDAARILPDHPLIGRPVRGDIRELVISTGLTGYVAFYRLKSGNARIEILTIRHQREAGYRE